MPRRSISVLDLTAGQECARFERIRHLWLFVSQLLPRSIWMYLGLGGRARIRGTTEGRGRYLFKE
jgi:hypothetical protein